jgi:hypothetical protein
LLKQEDIIHASIWKGLIDTYRSQIKKYCIYAISNFKVQQSTTYRPVSNELKIVFMYNTKLKEVNEQSDKILKYHFEFATKDILVERENKDVQCSGNSLYLYELRFKLCFIYTKDILTEKENKVISIITRITSSMY